MTALPLHPTFWETTLPAPPSYNRATQFCGTTQSKHTFVQPTLLGLPVHAVLLPRQAIPPECLKCLLFLYKPNMLLMKNVLPAFKFVLLVLLVAGVVYLFATNGGYNPLFKADSEEITSVSQNKEAILPPPCA